MRLYSPWTVCMSRIGKPMKHNADAISNTERT
jgi:hypothetical protein